ncbi:MAG: geranylgeranylglycerol-phosphate geranylgeranyltransferase [Cyclobacteriaceae bacterium]|nr:geranylgeranylglycerol-phosphate geranylgeranyltransferase [Cyclobacteriaceae bacterium]
MSTSKKSGSFSILGFLKLTRFPNLIMIGLSQYLSVIFLVSYTSDHLSIFFSTELFLLSASTIVIAAAGYIINDYYDVKIDYVNKPDRVVVGKLIKRRIVLISHTLLNLIGVAIGFYLSFYIGIINFFSAFLLWLYSNRLKHIAFAGNFTIALLTGLALLVVAVFYKENSFLVINYSVFAFSISLIREIVKDMEDVKGDERFGSKTLPVLLGIHKTKIILYFMISFFMVLLYAMALNLQNPILNNFFLLMSLPMLYFIYLLYRADTQFRFKQLSDFSKLIMLAGIISMAFF